MNTKSVGSKGKGTTSACVPSIYGVSNFCGTFTEKGYDASGNQNSTWTYNLLGNPPQNGKTTTIDAPIFPVVVELLNADNSVAYTIDPTGDVQPTVDSPVFSNAKYTSSPKPTQFADAVQRPVP